jgi:hypothetical protein
MAELTVQQATSEGIIPTFTAASAEGDVFTNNGKTYIHVKNDGASSIDVTIEAQRLCNFGELHNEVVSVGAGSEKIIGPFNPLQFNDATGKVNISYSDVTNVTVAVISI